VDIINKDDTAVVSPNAILKGRITIGPGCVIHPNASIIAHSPVELGANNIVEEQVIITNTQAYVPSILARIHGPIEAD
jgi:dynactin-6